MHLSIRLRIWFCSLLFMLPQLCGRILFVYSNGYILRIFDSNRYSVESWFYDLVFSDSFMLPHIRVSYTMTCYPISKYPFVNLS